MLKIDIIAKVRRYANFKFTGRAGIHRIILVVRIDLHICNLFSGAGVNSNSPDYLCSVLAEKAESYKKVQAKDDKWFFYQFGLVCNIKTVLTVKRLPEN